MAESINEISLEGFQVVSGEMFKHIPRKTSPTCTLFPTAVCFSKQSILALNNCEHIRMEVNTEKKSLLVIPVTARDPDGVRWLKSIRDSQARKIECGRFTEKLYQAWGWNPELRYRAEGRLVMADSKLMLLFDFSKPECFKKNDMRTARKQGVSQ